jgi:hypothetical protein
LQRVPELGDECLDCFYNSQNQVDKNDKPIPYTGCVNYSGVARDQCTVDAIVAFKSSDRSVLNETVQALLRSVPYGARARSAGRSTSSS